MCGCCIGSNAVPYIVYNKNNNIYESYIEPIKKYYIFKERVSSGHFGTVFKAYKRGYRDNIYAVKAVYKGKYGDREPIREVKILDTLDHPNIIKYYETYEESEFFYIVMEYIKGGDLLHYIRKNKKLNEKETAIILFQIVHAIYHCHKLGIIHRDLKPENILLLSASYIKLIDFGLSIYETSNADNIAGTPIYSAPEIYEGICVPESDIYSIGVIMYAMINGRLPNDNNKEFIGGRKAEDLCRKMLNKERKKRPKCIDILTHPFIVENIREYFGNITDTQIIENLSVFYPSSKLVKILIYFLTKYFEPCEKVKNFYYIIHSYINNAYEEENENMNDVCYSNFLFLYMKNKNLIDDQRLKKLFNLIDIEGKGYINDDSFYFLIRRTGKMLIKNEIKLLLMQSGFKNVNLIKYEEFKSIVNRLINQ